MRKALLWLGGMLVAAGIVVVGASAVMSTRGLSPSLNLGDPAKFEFILVPLWAVGLGLAFAGALCLLGWRRMQAV
jgi:hypothetical protein